MRIANAATLWLDARVFERDLGQIQVGQSVSAQVDGRPGETFSGEVILVHPRIDPNTRTALVRMELGNPGLALRDGMFATAFLKTMIAERAVVVPREAIIDTGSRQIAFVALDKGHFEPRQVEMGASGDDGMVEVLTGLAPGEEVVVSGQFLLDAESRMKEAIRRFQDLKAHPAPTRVTDASAEWKDAVEEALAAYLEMAGALGMPQEGEAPVDATRLVRAARTLAERAASKEEAALGNRLAAAASGMQDIGIDEQRESFAAVSEAAIDLALRAPRTGAFVPQLLITYCPMKKQRWMQANDTIQNPYYAREMKDCGDVVSSVPIAGTAPDADARRHGDERQ